MNQKSLIRLAVYLWAISVCSCSTDTNLSAPGGFVDLREELRSKTFSSVNIRISDLNLNWLPTSDRQTNPFECNNKITDSAKPFVNDTLTCSVGPIEYYRGHYAQIILQDSNRLILKVNEYIGGATGNTAALLDLGSVPYVYDNITEVISITNLTPNLSLDSLHYRHTYFERRGDSWLHEALGVDKDDKDFHLQIEIKP